MTTKLNLQKIAIISSFVVAPFILSGCAAALFTGATTTTVSQDSRSFSTMLYDEGIEQKSYEILKSNALLSKPEDFSISVTAFNGTVVLTGQTINKDYLKWAVSRIKKIEHVRDVYNYATLQKPVPASVTSSDALITSKAKTQLLFGKGISSNRFKVVTENGNVFLFGIVTQDEANRAVNEVLSIDGVRKVYRIFDIISVDSYTKNGPQSQEKVTVTPVKNNQNAYVTPHNARSNSAYNPNARTTTNNTVSNSSYVPPVSTQQNGGAYIMDEPVVVESPAYSQPSYNNSSNVTPVNPSVVNTSDDDLLRPAY